MHDYDFNGKKVFVHCFSMICLLSCRIMSNKYIIV